MKQAPRILFVIFILLLPACSSSDQAQTRAAPTRTPKAASSLAGQPAQQAQTSLPGRLLYVRDKQIWLREGASERALQIEGDVRDPAWSPDGKRIAFIRRDESFSDLYVMNAETGQTTRVTANGSKLQQRTQDYVHDLIWAAKPAWSPDGQELIFLSQKAPPTREGEQCSLCEFTLSLYRFRTRLIGTRAIPTNENRLSVDQGDSDILSPTWSPDGHFLAYVQASRDDKPRRIMLYNFETEEARQYPGIPDGAYDPAWSPDGQTLAFAINQDGATDIWAIQGIENGAPQRITKLGRARSPQWSPDGKMLAFVNVGDDGTDLYTTNLKSEDGRLQGGDPAPITEGAEIDASSGLSWGK
jgi:TolB protein